MARLFIVFAVYRSADAPQVGRYLQRLQRRYQPAALVVVDNAGDTERWRRHSFPVVIGDNRLREFSAWDDGITWLQQTQNVGDDDWVLFANDTVCRQAYLRWLTLGRARRVISHLIRSPATAGPAVAGPVMRCPMGEVRGFGEPFRQFVATFFFAMPYGTYRRIGGLGVTLPWNDWLGSAWPQPLFQLPGEADYNRFCNAWLGCAQAAGIGTWPGSRAHPFTPQNYAFLRGKAQCMLLEARLAAALVGQHPGLAVNLFHAAPWSVMWQRLFRLASHTTASALGPS
jgi:hypothetical protein